MAISFGLGMLFVVVVAAGGCRFGFFFFYLGFDIYYFIM